MKLWFSAKELAGIGGLSKHPSNVNRQARKEKWQSQPLKGVKGGGVEYFDLKTKVRFFYIKFLRVILLLR